MADGILVLFTTVAVCMDLDRQKIGNGWIGFGWFLGLIYRIYQYQLKGIGIFLTGSAVPILLLYVLFWFRMMGAGDIKLLSVIGGFIGPVSVSVCILVSLLFGAVLSVAVLLLCGNLLSRLRYFADYFKTLKKTKQVVPYMVRGKRMENIHFSVPILMGVLLYVGGIY